MDEKVIEFEALKISDLYVDCIYKGGKRNLTRDSQATLEIKSDQK